MNAAAILNTHNHWLRLACTHPLSESFHALLYALLEYTNTTFLDYKGGPPAAGTEPESVAQLAVTPNCDHAATAATYIERVFDQLFVVCILASYLTGEGDPRFAPPITRYPHAVLLEPSTAIEQNDALMRPVQPSETMRPLAELSESERTALLWKPRFRCIVATVNRFYHDAEHRNGAVLGMMFLVLMTTIAEIQEAVHGQLLVEHISEPDCATLFSFVTHELRAFAVANIDYQNAHEFWNTFWLSLSTTIATNNFARMEIATTARILEQDRLARELKESTERKRKSRITGKQRRKAGSAKSAADAADEMALLAGEPVEEEEYEEEEQATPDDDDDGPDDTLDDILTTIP